MFRTKRNRFTAITLLLAVALLASAQSFAAGPAWMPGFPMRMGTNVMLMWTPIPGATTYNLYRSDKVGDVGKMLISLPVNNHMDMNVPMDVDAAYTVKAIVGGAEGDASLQGVIKGVKPLNAPAFTGDLYQNGQLNVRWDAVEGAAFYNVFKSDKKDGTFTLAGSVQETKYVDAYVEPGNSYYYQVSAVDKNNVESPKSAVREVVLQVEKKIVQKTAYTEAPKLVKFKNYSIGGDETFKGPGWLAYNRVSNKIISSADNGLIIFNIDGTFAKAVNAPAGYQGEWGFPLCVAVAPDGKIWSTWRSGAFQIRVFTQDGEFIGEGNLDFPEEDYKKEKREADLAEDKSILPSPMGIAVDDDGNVWIADNNFMQISVFDQNLNLLKRIGSPRIRDVEAPDFVNAYMNILYNPKNNVVYALAPLQQKFFLFDAAKQDWLKNEKGEPFYAVDKAGSGTGYAQIIKGICLDGEGNVVVVSAAASTIQVWDKAPPQMAYKSTIQTDPAKVIMSELGIPFGVLVVDDKLFISEKASHRLDIFDM